jgi:repressor LexA
MPGPVGPADRGPSQVQQDILAFVCDYGRCHGYSPSYKEIGDSVGLKTNSVAYQIGQLEKMGYLSREPARPRSVVVTALYLAREQGDDMALAPLSGSIAAGPPILAFEDIEEDLLLHRSLAGYGALIALKVRGDSMIDAGINDGDVAVVRRQPRVETGEIAAAMVRDEVTGEFEATVKVYREYGGHAWLVPCNPAYTPISADDAIIIGKVTAVLHGGL